MIVADASIIVDILLRAPGVESIDARLFDTNESLHAPHLIDVEVAHVLRKYALRGELTETRGKSAMVLLQRFPITRHAHEPLLSRIWKLRDNLSAYDATYVALAEGLDATLVTRDAPLSSSSGHMARIELM
ncbi:MAG: type II toxin-antitoxin system VapC family toxin [Gemmatimonadaceae bacterium]